MRESLPGQVSATEKKDTQRHIENLENRIRDAKPSFEQVVTVPIDSPIEGRLEGVMVPSTEHRFDTAEGLLRKWSFYDSAGGCLNIGERLISRAIQLPRNASVDPNYVVANRLEAIATFGKPNKVVQHNTLWMFFDVELNMYWGEGEKAFMAKYSLRDLLREGIPFSANNIGALSKDQKYIVGDVLVPDVVSTTDIPLGSIECLDNQKVIPARLTPVGECLMRADQDLVFTELSARIKPLEMYAAEFKLQRAKQFIDSIESGESTSRIRKIVAAADFRFNYETNTVEYNHTTSYGDETWETGGSSSYQYTSQILVSDNGLRVFAGDGRDTSYTTDTPYAYAQKVLEWSSRDLIKKLEALHKEIHEVKIHYHDNFVVDQKIYSTEANISGQNKYSGQINELKRQLAEALEKCAQMVAAIQLEATGGKEVVHLREEEKTRVVALKAQYAELKQAFAEKKLDKYLKESDKATLLDIERLFGQALITDIDYVNQLQPALDRYAEILQRLSDAKEAFLEGKRKLCNEAIALRRSIGSINYQRYSFGVFKGDDLTWQKKVCEATPSVNGWITQHLEEWIKEHTPRYLEFKARADAYDQRMTEFRLREEEARRIKEREEEARRVLEAAQAFEAAVRAAEKLEQKYVAILPEQQLAYQEKLGALRVASEYFALLPQDNEAVKKAMKAIGADEIAAYVDDVNRLRVVRTLSKDIDSMTEGILSIAKRGPLQSIRAVKTEVPRVLQDWAAIPAAVQKNRMANELVGDYPEEKNKIIADIIAESRKQLAPGIFSNQSLDQIITSAAYKIFDEL